MGIEVKVVRNIRDTGTNRPNNSLSYTSVLACLCFTGVGVSPGGPGGSSHSEFILSGNRTTPTLCTALTRHNFFSISLLGALHRVKDVLRKRPSVGGVPNVSVSANSLNRKVSYTINVTLSTGRFNSSCGICAILNSNRVRRNRI